MSRKRTKRKGPRRNQSRSGRNKSGNARVIQSAIGNGWDSAAKLLDEKPRIAAIGNVLVLCCAGVIMGLILYWVTSNYTRQFDKAWIYAINTLIAMTIKLAFQWIMVSPAVRWVVNTIAKRIIPRRYWNQLPQLEGSALGTTLPNSMTVTAIATMILATELSKENVLPIWFIDSSHAVWVVALMGGITAALEGLSMPQTIFALWNNRHPYHSSPTYQRQRKTA